MQNITFLFLNFGSFVAYTMLTYPNFKLQWNPSITDTIGTQHFVPYSDVPNSGASGIFPVGLVLDNPVVEYNVAAFSELSFAVDNLPEKVDECLLNWGH